MKPKKHHLPLVRQRRSRGGALLRRDLFPDSEVTAVHKAPGDFPGGKEGRRADGGVHRVGHSLSRSQRRPAVQAERGVLFQIATDNQEETDRYWNAILRQRRARERVRLVQRPLGPVLSNHSAHAHRRPRRRGRGGEARLHGPVMTMREDSDVRRDFDTARKG